MSIGIAFVAIIRNLVKYKQLKLQNMKVAVWDTYVLKKDGNKMHFDILVPEHVKDADVIYQFGKEYLKGKLVKSERLTSKECEFCHIEEASKEIISDIEAKGYHIVEMENCD